MKNVCVKENYKVQEKAKSRYWTSAINHDLFSGGKEKGSGRQGDRSEKYSVKHIEEVWLNAAYQLFHVKLYCVSMASRFLYRISDNLNSSTPSGNKWKIKGIVRCNMYFLMSSAERLIPGSGLDLY